MSKKDDRIAFLEKLVVGLQNSNELLRKRPDISTDEGSVIDKLNGQLTICKTRTTMLDKDLSLSRMAMKDMRFHMNNILLVATIGDAKHIAEVALYPEV